MFHSLPIFSHPTRPRRGPRSLTRGGSENPVEQAEDGDGQQNDQRPDHTL